MKKFVKTSIISLLFILTSIATLNYFVDPYWCFDHNYPFNQYQKGSNERQQKTNQLYFGHTKYNALLLGSSRITYFNRRDLGEHVYNYACSDMQPKEYKAFIDFAINDAKQPIHTIYLGLDFYGSLSYGVHKFNQPRQYGEATSSSFYRYKLLLSIDSINNTMHNLKRFKRKSLNTYNRENIKTPSPLFGTTDNNSSFETIEYSRYKYHPKTRDPKFKAYLNELIIAYPNINFVVFTTPVSMALMDELIKEGLYSQYELWIRDISEVFGSINHFMFKNSVSIQNKYFMDSNHAYPNFYKQIAHALKNKECKSDMVMKIEHRHIDKHLKILKRKNIQGDK